MANARSGIHLVVKSLSPSRVWMPSYLCDVMLKAVEGVETRFYEVDYDLSVPSTRWLGEVGRGDLVLLVDYFGFPVQAGLVDRVKERGAWVLEDASQALLSEGVGRFADFVLFSPRKVLGVPDGGVLVVDSYAEWDDLDLSSPPVDWWLKTVEAAVSRREFDLCGGERAWFRLFREIDAAGPIGPYAMSELSRALLMHCFDYRLIAQKRIENYRVLNDRLGNWALFRDLPEGVVPLGFPLRLQERDRIRATLFEHEIYPPVHWPLDGLVPREFGASHRLATEIMTLPCDQRYDEQDMERMARLILGKAKG